MIIKPNPKQILLVDDDPLNLKLLTHYLEEAHYAYVACQDGQRAWNYLQQHPDRFFVVLSDRVMPRLHGLQLWAQMQLKKLNIPLILFSGEASKEERCEAFKQGIYDFFYKPISKELLLILLKKIERQRLYY
ncbi:response regulator [Rickettsiella grylli]|uniref:Response regulator receiver protein n=1 Tax=Rickettsiella grylli TaxID=59196 RepID=A8PQH3_9COXI|nr:response regulator [Rickettsiella grylli]EDP46037.1 response regulator receiver protein [Rickettsiella grylli]OJA00001.1 histidine kinase [Rickettsiella grylli]